MELIDDKINAVLVPLEYSGGWAFDIKGITPERAVPRKTSEDIAEVVHTVDDRLKVEIDEARKEANKETS